LSGAPQPGKVVLAVIDSLKPEMLEEAIEEDRAPALAALRERGTYIPDCVSTFPSVTPVASAAIATGCAAGEHHIPSMNWFHRGEERYIEYGSSFQASRAFGIVRSLYDTVYNMNLAHLSRARKTVFEHLDDAGLRTACTTYLIYRGRTRHDPSGESVYRRIGEALQFRHPVYGARELFYADLFDSRNTGCTSALGLPGQRDRHTGCVGAYLVEHDLFDFLLFSLPDNDTHSHRVGPEGQVRSIAEADRALERIMLVAGGVDAFLEDHAVIVMSDHSQTKVDERLNLGDAFPSRHVLAPADPAPTEAELALCPSARSAMVYILDEARRPELVPEVVEALRGLDGVDLVVTRQDGEAVVRSGRGELRFSPEGGLRDGRGRSWTVTGDRAALELEMTDGRIASESYPDALGRLWSALECPHTGDVLVSAAPGFECVDWGGGDHIGGGSHGSLHRDDSEGVLLISGLDVPERGEWAVQDVAPLVLDHFGVRLGG
jgi:Type I phosphodiesterase / nucleotide pyrophosphatase